MALLGSNIVLISYSSDSDPAEDQEYIWRLGTPSNEAATARFFITASLMQTGGADTPVAELSLEGSVDGENWATLMYLNTTGDDAQDAETSDGADVPIYMRAVLMVGGATAPAVEAVAQIWSPIPLTATEIGG